MIKRLRQHGPQMLLLLVLLWRQPAHAQGEGWIRLFDGKSLEGWTASESQSTYRVENGVIVARGPRAHLYYTGPVLQHNFKNFEFRMQVKTAAGANSGLYFQTHYQPAGYPDSGFEVQINNSGHDWKKTGCLYDIVDFGEQYARDSVWFTLYVKVVGRHVQVQVDGKQVIDYTEPAGFRPPANHRGRSISRGTFAQQAHDARSVIWFRDIEVRPLPDGG